jgi:hypothetical protein
MGPLISAQQREWVLGYMRLGQDEGAPRPNTPPRRSRPLMVCAAPRVFMLINVLLGWVVSEKTVAKSMARQRLVARAKTTEEPGQAG